MSHRIVVLLALALAATACSGPDDGTAPAASVSDPIEEPTLVPTPTAVVEPTAAPETTPVPDPTATPPRTPEVHEAPGALRLPLPYEPGEPGELIDREALEVTGAIGERILYHSTSASGDAVPVSGYVMLPDGDPPEGGWPLIAWAHGTVGLGDRCAPSHNAENDGLAAALTGFGYAVVSTDYEGLGTPGLHPYVVGASQAHGVLDSVRAARRMDLPISDEWIVFGHSQGGHAAMFAAQLWPTYAPELDLIGAVAGAPPSQMADLGESLIGGDFQGYLVMTAAGLAAADPDLDLAQILTTEALALLDVLETGCTGEIFDAFNPLDYADMVRVEAPFELENWGGAIEAQDTNRLPVTVPLLIIHGGDDEQIPVETSAALFEQLCGFDDQGPTVRNVYPGQDHAGVLVNFAAVPDLLAFFEARFAGSAPSDECPSVVAAAPTIDELLAREEPLLIAHGGGDQETPHSTMFAYHQAAAAGADVLELDVLATVDDVLIVQHDLTVDGTTGSSGVVAELTYAEIDALDNAYWFAEECWPCRDLPDESYLYRGVRTGERPPPDDFVADDFSVATLQEVAESFPELPLDIEIKGEGAQALHVAELLAAELDRLGRIDSVVVVSFDDDVIDAFHELAPDVAISPGTDRLTIWVLTGAPLDERFAIVQIPPFAQGFEVATVETIATAHEQGLEVWVWPDDAATQENRRFYAELLARGVDGIIAGRPSQFPD